MVRTRFVLIADPDFYIVRPDWIRGVVGHMEVNRVGFFGAPWHPRWYRKYRYFPSVHCLFIDLASVESELLDFLPGTRAVTRRRRRREPGMGGLAEGDGKNAVSWRGVAKSASSLISNLWHRASVGASEDTGIGVFRRYGRAGQGSYECLVPTFRLDDDYAAPPPRRFSLGLDLFLPDRLSYRPKRAGYYTTTRFRDVGFLDAARYGWEEFMWQGKPFGFHVRGHRLRKRGLGDDSGRVAEALGSTGWVRLEAHP